MIVEKFPDRIVSIKGQEYHYFGGTSYLGIATNVDFHEILFQNIKKWGTFYGSSRNSNIKLAVYNTFEYFFAKQIGAEASLAISSGTLAGRLVIDYLSKSITSFYHYPKTHPSVLAPNSLPLFDNGALHSSLLNNTTEEIVITVDAVLAMEVTPTSFDFLAKISASKKITLVIDESHSLGIVGKHGEGVFNTIPTENLYQKIAVSSLGKALGLSGGIIAGNAQFINLIKEESIFISASGANPAYLETYLQTQEIYTKQREKLQNNLAFLYPKLTMYKHLRFSQNYPVIYSNEPEIYTALSVQNIVVTNFNYPTYKNTMHRIVITANHTEPDLKTLSLALSKKEKF